MTTRYDGETTDFDNVKQNPEAWYHVPQAVLDDPQLRRAEKQELLDEWARDIADRTAAADEGMVQDAPGLIDRDVRMQDKVVAAQKALEGLAADEAGMSLPERLWRRIVG